MGKKEDLNLVREFAKKISLIYPDSKVIFFGSRAKGKPNEWSDFDIIVVSEKFKQSKKFKRNSKLYDNWDADCPVDFLCYTPKEFNKLKKQINVVKEAVEKGIEIK